jgi:hypothetical protein
MSIEKMRIIPLRKIRVSKSTSLVESDMVAKEYE